MNLCSSNVLAREITVYMYVHIHAVHIHMYINVYMYGMCKFCFAPFQKKYYVRVHVLRFYRYYIF